MFDLEKFKTDKYYVHLPTQELYDEAMDFLDNNGFKWKSGNKMNYENFWKEYKEKTCISINEKEEIVRADTDFYLFFSKEKLDLNVEKPKLKVVDDELKKLHSYAEVNAQLGLVRTLSMGKRSNEER